MQFKDIKNQRVLINKLTEIIDSGRVSHAQLFLGETRSGSLALAVAYMQYLSCSNRQHYRPVAPEQWCDDYGNAIDLRADSCGSCPSCRKFMELVHSDVHLVFPNITTTPKGSENPSAEDFQAEFRDFMTKYGQYGTLEQWYYELDVENKQGMIREKDAANVVRYVTMRPYEAEYKMIVIWCPETMNSRAANELLKSIEEPYGKTLIILVTENTERILPTIMSRVQLVRVPSLSLADMFPADFAPLFVDWMRMLFKLNMARLAAWTDSVSKMGRERQKQFLAYSLEALRCCFLLNVTPGAIQPDGDFGEAKFNHSFYTGVTGNNISLMNDAINHTLRAIERNATPGLAFMALSFKMSSYILKK